MIYMKRENASGKGVKRVNSSVFKRSATWYNIGEVAIQTGTKAVSVPYCVFFEAVTRAWPPDKISGAVF